MAETQNTARPQRRRAAATKAAPAKPATEATDAAQATAPASAEVKTSKLLLTHSGDTKNFRRFDVPDSSGCRGSLYAPHDVVEIRVLMIHE